MVLYNILLTMCVVIFAKTEARSMLTEIVNSVSKNNNNKIFNLILPTRWNDLELNAMKIIINGSLKTDGKIFNTTLRTGHVSEDCFLIYNLEEGLFYIKGPTTIQAFDFQHPYQPGEILKFSLMITLKGDHRGQTFTVFFQINDNLQYIGSELIRREINHIEIKEGVKSIDSSLFELIYDTENL